MRKINDTSVEQPSWLLGDNEKDNDPIALSIIGGWRSGSEFLRPLPFLSLGAKPFVIRIEECVNGRPTYYILNCLAYGTDEHDAKQRLLAATQQAIQIENNRPASKYRPNIANEKMEFVRGVLAGEMEQDKYVLTVGPLDVRGFYSLPWAGNDHL